MILLGALLVLAAPNALAGEWNVGDHGAVGDGQQDNTKIFQRVLDEAGAAGGGVVHVPAGHYRIDGTLSIPGAVTLQGVFRVPPTDQREGRPKLDGSALLAYAGRGSTEGEPFIRLAGSTATLAGFIITYPEWKFEDVPPVPYPPTVFAEHNVNVGVLDCCFLNSYEAIHFDFTGRFLVRNVYGYPSFRGLYVDNCYDVGRVENCHFWPFGVVYKVGDPYCEWINVNGVAFEFARTDWQYVVNTFCFGYGVGYKFTTSKSGSCNGNFLGIGADSCRRSVLVDTVPGTIDLLITNGEFVGRWGSMDSVGVEVVGKTTGRVGLSNCAFWGPLDRCIWVQAPNARLTASACGFSDWDINAMDSPAVQADGGKVIIQGNTFSKEGLHVRVGEKVQSAIVNGNQAVIGMSVENHAGDRTQLVANEVDTLTWPRGARRHYRVDVGGRGDSRYVRGCHGRERARPWNEDGVMRWTGAAPRLILPVQPRAKYDLTLDVHIPPDAMDPANGVFLGTTRLAELPPKEGPALVTIAIPEQDADTVTLSIRNKAWKPAPGPAGINDARQLGIALRSMTMKASRAPKRIFNANDGSWLE